MSAGQALTADDVYFITVPRFQTSAEKYRLLNEVQAVGKMVSFKPGDHVRYDIFVAH